MDKLSTTSKTSARSTNAISSDVRDPYTELARLRTQEPVQRLRHLGSAATR